MIRYSFIISTFNEDSKYLFDSISSCLTQKFTNFEIIIVNDGGVEIENIWNDDRIFIYNRKSNHGLANSLNFAVSKSQGEFLVRLDTDDINHNLRLCVVNEYIEKYTNYDVYFSNYFLINSENKKIDKIKIRNISLCAGNPYCHGTMVIKRTRFLEVGGYSDFLMTSQDYELYFRLKMVGSKFLVIPDFLYSWRLHSNQISSKKIAIQMRNTSLIQNYYCLSNSELNFHDYYFHFYYKIRISGFKFYIRLLKSRIKKIIYKYASKV